MEARNRKITVLKGHLTQTEKKHINAFFALNMLEAKVNRKTYYCELLEDGSYRVEILENEYSPVRGSMKIRTHVVIFKF